MSKLTVTSENAFEYLTDAHGNKYKVVNWEVTNQFSTYPNLEYKFVAYREEDPKDKEITRLSNKCTQFERELRELRDAISNAKDALDDV